MNIQHPIDINFDYTHDEGQESLLTEAQILKYIQYLMGLADKLDMDVRISCIPYQEPQLDREDNRLLNLFFPMYHIAVYDDNDLLGEFSYSCYTVELYDSFKAWVKSDILFYMKSKANYRELLEKHPERMILYGKPNKI